jgi:hypothetical protein
MQEKSVEGLSNIEVMGEFNPFRSLVSKLRFVLTCDETQLAARQGLRSLREWGELGSGDRDRWEVRELWERTRRKEHKQTKGDAVWGVGPRIRPIKRVLV